MTTTQGELFTPTAPKAAPVDDPAYRPSRQWAEALRDFWWDKFHEHAADCEPCTAAIALAHTDPIAAYHATPVCGLVFVRQALKVAAGLRRGYYPERDGPRTRTHAADSEPADVQLDLFTPTDSGRDSGTFLPGGSGLPTLARSTPGLSAPGDVTVPAEGRPSRPDPTTGAAS
jgi:hypothetical protein